MLLTFDVSGFVACSSDQTFLDEEPESSSPSDIGQEPGADSDDLAASDADDRGDDYFDAYDDTLPVVTISGLRTIENPSNSLSTFVLWETDRPSTTELEVDCGEQYEHRFTSDAPVTKHEVFAMGLFGGARCEVTARSEGSSGYATASTTLAVSAPPGFLPQLAIGSSFDTDRIQPGWTLVGLSSRDSRTPLTGVLVDAMGRVRWYHRLDVEVSGADNALSVVEGGVMFGGGSGIDTQIVDWDGVTRWTAPFTSHHEAALLGDSAALYVLRPTETCPQDDVSPVSAVVAWDLDLGSELWRWHLCDYYQPPVDFTGWGHLNGIDMFPEGDAIVVSSRNQSALYRVDRSDGEIEWIMGYAGRPEDGWNGDFDMSQSDRFLEQHAPEVQPSGNLLLFDNGSCDSCSADARPMYERRWSRAVEIAYDTSAWEAEVVWEYRPHPDIFATTFGDADRLGNGNTLVTFGLKSSTSSSRIHEVTAEGELVWELVVPEGWGVYRADRVAPELGRVVGSGDAPN